MTPDNDHTIHNAPEEEIVRLRGENAELYRRLSALEATVDRYKLFSSAKAKLSAVINAEKSKQEKYMSLLLENCPDIIMLFDQSGQFAYCTEAFLKTAHIPNYNDIDEHAFDKVFRRFATIHRP